MELQALLVLCGVGVAGLAVLLLMGLFSTSGTSYEEAIAQQRRATTELLALAESKNKPKKKEKKANKKLAKKEKNKENTAATTGSELESEAPAESGLEDDSVPPVKGHVEFCPPVVVDVPRDTPPNVKVSEKVEEVAEKKEAKPVKPAKGGKATKPAPPADPVKEEVARERHNSGEGAKEQRKAKKVEKKPPTEEVVETVREEVVPPLNVPQPSELTTDKLLKQAAFVVAPAQPAASPPAGKNKKKKPEPNVLSLMAGDSGGVNVGELVRVVREAALSRTEIQILTDALLNKHHDPLPEHSEWTEGPNDPMQKLKKQLADKEKALADEVEASQALHAKLKELRATLNAERSRAAAGAAAARAELHTLQARLQRLLDDNHQHAQDKLLLQSKLGAEGEAQAQRVQLEVHIQRLSESEAALLQQLSALQGELNAHALEASRAAMDAAAARDAAMLAQQHAADLAQQLQEANRACNELEQQRQCAALGEQRAQQELRQAQEHLLAMTELQNEVQRLASHAQTAESNAEKLKEEFEKQKQQLSSELTSLRELLVERETELAELKQMKAVPAQNGLPTSNADDQLKAAELSKVEGVVAALRDELAAAQRAARDQRDHIARLADQLHHYQDKNNEAIAKAQAAQYTEVANVLRAVCPSAAPSSAAGRDWLQAFADNLKQEIEKMRAEKDAPVPEATANDDDRIKDLISQNEHSQSLVEKYKRIINDTEGVLSRLQQDVSSEEQRWAQQLADKQRELDEVRQRTVLQMQNKIDTLQAELHQVKAGTNNHTFAEAERSAEERLMAGLSDKHNSDVCNGPLQVGLEEK